MEFQDLIKDLREMKTEQIKNFEASKEAIKRFIGLAEGCTDQSRHARRILFSIYDPNSFSMNARDFSALDYSHANDATLILNQYSKGYISLFKSSDDFEKRIEKLVDTHNS